MSDVKTEDVFRVSFLVKYLFLFVIKNIELLKPPFFTSYLIVLFCNVLILMTIYPLSFLKKIRWIHIRFTYSPKKNSSHLEAILKFRYRKQKLINRTKVFEIWQILLCFFKPQTQN